MIVVLPTHPGDWQLARSLLEWCQHLGGCRRHTLLILPSESLSPHPVSELKAIGGKVFNSVRVLPGVKPLMNEKWPRGANAMFKAAIQHTAMMKRPWLWLEPDCVPMKSGWMDQLESEYQKCGKEFMGHFVRTNSPRLPEFVLTGIAIYPPDCTPLLKHITRMDVAFDISITNQVIRKAHDSALIWQYWGTKNQSPTFTMQPIPPKNRHLVGLWHIPKTCVLFHRCKNGSLISLLKMRAAATLARGKDRHRKPKTEPEKEQAVAA